MNDCDNKEITKAKQDLMREYDSKKITKDQYEIKMKELEGKEKSFIRKFMDRISGGNKMKNNIEDNVIDEEQSMPLEESELPEEPGAVIVDETPMPEVSKPKPKKIHGKRIRESVMTENGLLVAGFNSNSCYSEIIQVLSLGKVKNVEELVNEVLRRNPNFKESTIISNFSALRGFIKMDYRNFKLLKWDKTTFTVSLR